jgi:PhzF family phenazine biosynthesis protein
LLVHALILDAVRARDESQISRIGFVNVRGMDVRFVTVFADGPGGGNPTPIVLGAAGMSGEQMQQLARAYGAESTFVVDHAGTGCDLALRFWVPNHEMSMCGHATLGTVWLLARLGRLPQPGEVSVHTASGAVRARIAADGAVVISQPAGRLEPVGNAAEVLDVLGLRRSDLADQPIRNATTSRTKTLVPLRDVERLDSLTPKVGRVEQLCRAIGSTGLYPYAASGERRFDARQFPRSSGYPEDAATGIAATALAFGLLADGVIDPSDRPLTVRQGRAMGRPSVISVRLDVRAGSSDGCWLGGPVALAAPAH